MNQFWTFQCIFLNNFKDFLEAYSLLKICKIVLEHTLKCSQLISSSDNKKILLTTRNVRLDSGHYATGCFVAFLGDISTLKSGWNMKKLFCCPALELFHCLPLWKTVLFVSSRASLLSTPTFLFSTPVEKSEATWKKATKCNKQP